MAARRRVGWEARGSSRRARWPSRVVTDRNTAAALSRAKAVSTSTSRVTSALLVTITTGLRNSANTSRQRRVRQETTLDRLVGIRDATHGQDLGVPARGGEGTAQQRRRIVLDEDLGLKIQASREAEIFMGGTGITIDTAVLTSSVRINTIGKPHVRTRIGRENRAGRVFEKLGGGGGILRVRPVRVADVPERCKAVGGIAHSPTAMGHFLISVHGLLSLDMADACYATMPQHGTSTD